MFLFALTALVILSTLYFATSVDRQLIGGVAAVTTLLVVFHGFVHGAGLEQRYAWTQSKQHTAILPETLRADAIRHYAYGDYGYDYDTNERKGGLYFDGHEYRHGDALSELSKSRYPYRTPVLASIPTDNDARGMPVQGEHRGSLELEAAAHSAVQQHTVPAPEDLDPQTTENSQRGSAEKDTRLPRLIELREKKEARAKIRKLKKEERAAKKEAEQGAAARAAARAAASVVPDQNPETSQAGHQELDEVEPVFGSTGTADHTMNNPVGINVIEERESGERRCARGEQMLQSLQKSFVATATAHKFKRAVYQLSEINKGRTDVKDKNLDTRKYCWVTLLKLVDYLLDALAHSRDILQRQHPSEEFNALVDALREKRLKLSSEDEKILNSLKTQADAKVTDGNGYQFVNSTLTQQ